MYLSKSYEWFQLPGSDGGAVSTVVLPSKVKVKILPKKVIKQIWIHKQVNEEKIFASKNSTTQPNTQTTLWGMGASVSHTHDTLYIKSF